MLPFAYNNYIGYTLVGAHIRLSITISNVLCSCVDSFLVFFFCLRTSLLDQCIYIVPQNQTMGNLNKRCNKGMMIVDGCSKLV